MSLKTEGLGINVELSGVQEMLATLKDLGARRAENAAKAGMRAGVKPVLAALREEVKKVHKVTGTLAKSPGSKVDDSKNNDGIVTGKVGLNVGTKRQGYRISYRGKDRYAVRKNARKTAPHAHLIALGTKMRNFEGANRGKIAQGRPMVPTAVRRSARASLTAMAAKLRERLEQEVAKARKS